MAEPDAKRSRLDGDAPRSPSDVCVDDEESSEPECEFQDTLPRPALCPRRLRGRSVRLVEKVNDDYLAMLNDHDRNLFYWRSLESLPVEGRRVLDLGAGTGLLSLMAARLGAKSVLAIDESADMAEVVRWSAQHSELADTITAVAGHSTSVTIPEDERADVIVSETFGVLLLQEDCLNSFVHARTHLAKPGATIVPSGGRQYAMLLMSPTLREASSTLAPAPMELDMSHVGQLRETCRVFFSTPGGFCINSLPDCIPMSDRIQVLGLDFHTATCDDVPAEQTFELKATRSGQIDAVVTSWEAWSKGGHLLTTHAEDTKTAPWGFARDAHWGQGVQFVEDMSDGLAVPFSVVEGDELRLTVRFSSGGGTSCQFALERSVKSSGANHHQQHTSERPLDRSCGSQKQQPTPSQCDARPEDDWLSESACVPLLCDAESTASTNIATTATSGNVVSRYEHDHPSGFNCPERLCGLRPALVQIVNDDYYALLNHAPRARFFWDALESLSLKGKRVIDLGAGAGELSVLAAKCGAEHVLALESSSEMVELARKSAQKNGVSDSIQVVHCLSSRIEIPEAQRADVIVCEPYDIFMTGQGFSGTIDYLVDARRRLAKPDACVIPAGGAQYARLIMSAGLSNRATVSGDKQGGLSEVSLSNLGELLDTATLVQSRKKGFRWSCLPDLTFMSERVSLFTVDFGTAERNDIPRKQSMIIDVLHDGFVDAVVTSWEVWAGSDRSVRLSAHAEESSGFGQDVVFGQGIQLLAEESSGSSIAAPVPFAVHRGETLTLTAHVSEQRELLHFTLHRGSEPVPARGRGKRRGRGRGRG
eukprot:TRINITY_DN46352_c0_g1_i1.p1 TRINITY_DN46352_c0_g1~~TRINITY_DN46352_c0_g1_i1.p1  ORF type:complete len:835 (+),score=89.14 TRINITY_DN46352_c0_g1_i1:46-2505(+)